MQNPETSISAATTATRQFLAIQLALQTQASPGERLLAAELGKQELQRQGPGFALMQRDLLDVLEPNGAFSEALIEGAYNRIARFAGSSAVAATDIVTSYRREQTLSVGDAFATHAFITATSYTNGPSKTRTPNIADRTTFFLTHFAGELAKQVDDEELAATTDTYAISAALKPLGQRLGESIGLPGDWVTQKFHTLAEFLDIRRHTKQHIEAEAPHEVDDVGELARNNDALFKQLSRLRRYSIKSAVHQSGDAAWSIHDGLDRQAQLAVIASTSEVKLDKWPPNIRLMAVEHFEYTDQLYHLTTEVEDVPVSRKGLGRSVFMDDKGQLFADHNGILNYKDLYACAGKPQNYEVLRQNMLRYYFDLTVPTEVAQQVIADEQRLLGADAPSQKREPAVYYADLLLPRIRRLKSFKTAGEMELFEPEPEVVAATDKKKLELPLHPVEAHRRLLPPGYQPSANALALAEELGITLEPGETVVKKHNRGDEKFGVVAHRGKQRRK